MAKNKGRKSQSTSDQPRKPGSPSVGFSAMAEQLQSLNLGDLPDQASLTATPATVPASHLHLQRGDKHRYVEVIGSRTIAPERREDGSLVEPEKTYYQAPVRRRPTTFERLREVTEPIEVGENEAIQFGKSGVGPVHDCPGGFGGKRLPVRETLDALRKGEVQPPREGVKIVTLVG